MGTNRRFLIAMLLVLVTSLGLTQPILPAEALRDRKALLPVADSQVRSASPDYNFGRVWELWVTSDSEEILSYIMFDLSQLPAGTTVIEEATLRLFEDEESGTSKGMADVHYCPSNDWTEDGITYNTKPAFQPEPIDTVNVTSVYRWYEWNVTSIAISTLRGQDKRLSLTLDGDTDGHLMVFYSRQSPVVDKRPELSILYTYSPQSGVDPVLVGLIAVVTVGISGTGLGLVYTRRKKRKQP